MNSRLVIHQKEQGCKNMKKKINTESTKERRCFYDSARKMAWTSTRKILIRRSTRRRKAVKKIQGASEKNREPRMNEMIWVWWWMERWDEARKDALIRQMEGTKRNWKEWKWTVWFDFRESGCFLLTLKLEQIFMKRIGYSISQKRAVRSRVKGRESHLPSEKGTPKNT